MIILEFKGRGVNGYLDFDITFNNDLTFLTGINGSGKTSALNSITSLLVPRIDYLTTAIFDEISITILHNSKKVTLKATKDNGLVILTCSLFKDENLAIPEFTYPRSIPDHRAREYYESQYKDFLSENSKNPIISFIGELPTPMYLGLDRRAISAELDQAIGSLTSRGQSLSNRRNIFGRTLRQSLSEAERFAELSFRRMSIQKGSLDTEIRDKLVLELLDFPPITLTAALKSPQPGSRERIQEAKVNINKLPDILKITEDTIKKNVEPLFDFLVKKLDMIGKNSNKKSERRALDSEDYMNALIDWSFNQTHLVKINRISEIITKYNDDVDKIFRKRNNFLTSVNSFMNDSGKRIIFDELGELKFSLESEGIERDVGTLSSGEIQLLVILAHLYFNPEVENANVFIIDEPELSLHVQWQEKFVDRITSASDRTQFILATHSPSIILDKVSNCKEIRSNK